MSAQTHTHTPGTHCAHEFAYALRFEYALRSTAESFRSNALARNTRLRISTRRFRYTRACVWQEAFDPDRPLTMLFESVATFQKRPYQTALDNIRHNGSCFANVKYWTNAPVIVVIVGRHVAYTKESEGKKKGEISRPRRGSARLASAAITL